jgi:hypothetical protein
MSPTDVFDCDEAGNIVTRPLTNYSTMPVADMFVLARLEYATSEDHLQGIMSGNQKADAVQMAITPAQARELAARLTFLADHITGQATPDESTRN